MHIFVPFGVELSVRETESFSFGVFSDAFDWFSFK